MRTKNISSWLCVEFVHCLCVSKIKLTHLTYERVNKRLCTELHWTTMIQPSCNQLKTEQSLPFISDVVVLGSIHLTEHFVLYLWIYEFQMLKHMDLDFPLTLWWTRNLIGCLSINQHSMNNNMSGCWWNAQATMKHLSQNKPLLLIMS